MNRELKPFVQPTIFLIALNVLPSVGERPLWSLIFAFVMLIYRWWLDFKNLKNPPRWFQWGVQGAIVLAVWQHFHSILGDESAGCLLMLLTCVKTFELNQKRDYFTTAILCLLLLMSTLLLTQSLLLSAFLVFDVLLVLAYLHALENNTLEGLSWRKALRQPLTLLMKSLPIMILIFFLFPRFSTGFGTGTDSLGRTGISSELKPGSVSGLISSDQLVFRATFLDTTPPRQELYWRGSVLDISKGLNWERSRTDAGQKAPVVGDSEDVEIYLEPGYGRYLFSLDTTVGLSFPNDLNGTTLRQFGGRIYQLNQVLQTRERYYLRNADVLPEEAADPAQYLAVDKPSPEMERFLKPLRGKREYEVVNALLQHFRNKGYQYSLQPPRSDSIDQFFFETKTGFCEHYAATTATILRYLKIPSRVIVGFQGGTVSFLDNYVSVREHDAHAWVEYFDLTNKKWRRIDPTAQVAIDRISMGSEAYIKHGEGFLPNWVPNKWALGYLKGRAFFDEMDASWISFLLRFDMARQREWLQKLGMEEVMFRALPVFLMLALVLVLALLYFFEAQRPERLSLEERLYRGFLKQTKRWQLEKSAFEGLGAWLQRLESHSPELAIEVRPFVERLIWLRFGPVPVTAKDLKEIRSQLKGLKKLSIKSVRH